MLYVTGWVLLKRKLIPGRGLLDSQEAFWRPPTPLNAETVLLTHGHGFAHPMVENLANIFRSRFCFGGRLSHRRYTLLKPVIWIRTQTAPQEGPERAPSGLLVRMTSIGGAENAA